MLRAWAVFVLFSLTTQDSDAAKKARSDLASLRASVEKLVTLIERINSIDEQLRKGSGDEDRPKTLALQRQEALKEFEGLRGATIQSMEALLASAGEDLKKTPDDAGLLDVRSQALLMYKRDELALGDLERLVKLRPDDVAVALRAGRLEEQFNLYDEAAANLERILKKDPDHAESKGLLALCYFATHRFEESLPLFDASLQSPPAPEFGKRLRMFRKLAASCVESWKREMEIRAKEEKADNLPRATISTSRGDIDVELFEDQAPNAVANFVELVTKKFYDGLKFHRVESGFMAQTGCPRGDGSGEPGYRFKDEFPDDYRRHFRGSLSMANSGADTNGSQFFITHLPTEWLNGKHTVFGRVVKGQDVVDRLRVGDEIKRVVVTRKRDHPYAVRKIGDEK